MKFRYATCLAAIWCSVQKLELQTDSQHGIPVCATYSMGGACGCQGIESAKCIASLTVRQCKRRTHGSCMQALQEKGHHVEATSWGAVVQGIIADPSDGYLTGVSDPRKDGAPAGY